MSLGISKLKLALLHKRANYLEIASCACLQTEEIKHTKNINVLMKKAGSSLH